jgi:hypothetical protein
MEDFAKVYKWITRNFVRVSILIFVIVFLRWFQLTPLMFYNDPDFAYIVGLILLGLYVIFATLTKLLSKFRALQMLLLIPTSIFFVGNILYILAFFPLIEFTAKCGEKTYYITWMHPFGDYQWNFYNVTIWDGPFKYDSFFFGYSGGGYRIVCDDERNETNIINTSRDVLTYIDSNKPLLFDEYNGVQLKNHRYFLAEQCNDWVPSTCGSLTYTLYQCNFDFKSCGPLPIQYTQYDTRDFLDLSADESTSKINLREEDFETNEVILIFTYSDQPQCYVEDCKILEN